ncbi:hypothetical protein OAJ13_01395 [Euryarchaeota archaeon]|nr:hypothetical protein [Euryarchaeota archaeon]
MILESLPLQFSLGHNPETLVLPFFIIIFLGDLTNTVFLHFMQ